MKHTNKTRRSDSEAWTWPYLSMIFIRISGEIGSFLETGEDVVRLNPCKAIFTKGFSVGEGKPAKLCVHFIAADAESASDFMPVVAKCDM